MHRSILRSTQVGRSMIQVQAYCVVAANSEMTKKVDRHFTRVEPDAPNDGQLCLYYQVQDQQ